MLPPQCRRVEDTTAPDLDWAACPGSEADIFRQPKAAAPTDMLYRPREWPLTESVRSALFRNLQSVAALKMRGGRGWSEANRHDGTRMRERWGLNHLKQQTRHELHCARGETIPARKNASIGTTLDTPIGCFGWKNTSQNVRHAEYRTATMII
jgi:hypothetical protein